MAAVSAEVDAGGVEHDGSPASSSSASSTTVMVAVPAVSPSAMVLVLDDSGMMSPPITEAVAVLDVYVEASGLGGPGDGALPEYGSGGSPADGLTARAAGGARDEQAARLGRGAAALDVLPHIPGDEEHGVPSPTC